MTTRLSLFLLVLFSACPPVNSTPCAEDSECRDDQRCRRGACGPICLDDTECGDRQVCLPNGTCGAPPECAVADDCASGFICSNGRCTCTSDQACAANQRCESGTCTLRPRCTDDVDCPGNERCELTAGQCLPACFLPTQCAPQLDPRIALALYNCDKGTCRRRCTEDFQCGSPSLICSVGMCANAECDDLSDCPEGRYCSGAAFGRCRPLTLCSTNTECERGFECRTFNQLECPPGFDCNQRLCVELPTCVADQDCVQLTDGGLSQNGYCDYGHCLPAEQCATSAACDEGTECVGGVCVPQACRGHLDCDGGSYCVSGACTPEISGLAISALRLSPPYSLLVQGDTLALRLRANGIDGNGTPISTAQYTVTSLDGGDTSVATVQPDGVLTAVAPGEVLVRAQLPQVNPSNQVRVQVLPPVTMGRRVIVTDAATGQPLEGVIVRACQGTCDVPTDVTTTIDGLAEFPLLNNQPTTFTAVPTALRSDGLPEHERASILDTTVQDVALPLRENPVQSAAGFSGSISFTYVSTSGSLWAGFIAASAPDVPSLTPQRLLGENFMVEIPGVGQRVPIPGPVVLYTSPGLNIPQEVKPRALGFAQPGTGHFAQAWAGRAYPTALSSLRSIELLSYLSAFDYAQATRLDFTNRPYVEDVADLDGDGLCASMTSCPAGTEQVPDYANFTSTPFTPNRPQQLRTEVVVQPVPSNFDTVLVATALVDTHAGLLPTGFASRTPNPAGQDGLRAVDPVVVRGGAAHNGTEVAPTGIWALAVTTDGDAFSARVSVPPQLGSQHLMRPFLPAPANASWSATTRTFNLGQPVWSSIFSNGGDLGRVSLTGSETRHVLYFPMGNGQNELTWPSVPPGGAGVDPAEESAAQFELVAVDLINSVTLNSLFDAPGLTLSTWARAVDGYSRLDR